MTSAAAMTRWRKASAVSMGIQKLSQVALIGNGQIGLDYRKRIASLKHRDHLMGNCDWTPHVAQPSVDTHLP